MAKKTHPKVQARDHFNGEVAPDLAHQVKASERTEKKGWSKRFAYFFDTDGRFVVVAGDQEAEEVDLALAYGLTYRADQRLVLVLPAGRAFPTLQRAPWLAEGARPVVHLHDGSTITAREVALPTPDETKVQAANVTAKTPAVELRDASMPMYLKNLDDDLVDLVEWATKDPRLDPGHRRGERSWHCMGQRVLSIRPGSGTKAPAVRGGIHRTTTGEPAFDEEEGTAPIATTAEVARKRAEEGIDERLGGRLHKPDEHWLQAVIRRTPSLVGVEQPALREVPAWRPSAKPHSDPAQPGAWGRGFIDLVGLDGHGDLRIVETKLTKNQDELLFLQGLDYYIWACSYWEPLRVRLGASDRAQIEVHYVIGDDPKTGKVKVSRFGAAIAEALQIPWRVQTVHDWFHGPETSDRASSKLLPKGELPGK